MIKISNLIFLLMTLVKLLHSQPIPTDGRAGVMERMRYYLNKPFIIDTLHTNKWQSNFYASKSQNGIYYDESTFRGLEESYFGAPYGYGIKDDPEGLQTKIYNFNNMEPEISSWFVLGGNKERVKYKYELDTYFLNKDAYTFVITSTDYLDDLEQYLIIDVLVDNTNIAWKLYLRHHQYVWNKAAGGSIQFEEREIWSTDDYWQAGYDSTRLYTGEIKKTGIYELQMVVQEDVVFSDTINATIKIEIPITIPGDVYACGAHYGDHKICVEQGLERPGTWAFGIDCSGYISYGYGLHMGSYGTWDYSWDYAPVAYEDADSTDYLVNPGSHIVMIAKRDTTSDYDIIDIFESAGELDLNVKPDGIALNKNKRISIDYADYDLRTPFSDEKPPSIENIYLSPEDNSSELPLEPEYLQWKYNIQNFSYDVRPKMKYDIIVRTFDERVDYPEFKWEVKEIIYKIFVDDTITESDTGFISRNQINNYGNIENPDSLQLIYGDGTNIEQEIYEYIITNKAGTVNDTLGTLDLTNYPDQTKIKIMVTAVDWSGNSITSGIEFVLFSSPPSACDEINPTIEKAYLVNENNNTEEEISFTKSGSRTGYPIIDPNLGSYDVIVHAYDMRPDASWKYAKNEAYKISYIIKDSSVHNEQIGFEASTIYNYENLSLSEREYVYAGAIQ